MKKPLIFFFVAIASICSAQVSLKFGAIRSTLHSTEPNLIKNDAKITPFFGGIYYGINVGNLIGLETGLQYQAYSDQIIYLKSRRDYLSVPLTLNYKPKSLISPGIGLQASQSVNKKSSNPYVEEKGFDFMALAKININPFKSLGLEVGYNIGLIPFSSYSITGDLGQALGEQNLSNRYMYLALRYTM